MKSNQRILRPCVYTAALLAFTFIILAGSTAAAQQSRPNILLIVGDDMGYADVGFHGCRDIPTPSLDALAASGVRFTNGYVTGPYCSPTRAGLMTGQYQTRFGHEFNPSGAINRPMLAEGTLAKRLKAAGYATALAGKWHLGDIGINHPRSNGFDLFYGFLGGQHDYFDPAGIFRGSNPIQGLNETLDYTTDAFGREALSFIDQNKGRPWFLYLAFNAVHTPMQATAERLARFSNIEEPQRRTYAAMMLAMDEVIGRVIQKVTDAGLRQNTLIFFISDNGGPVMPGTTVNRSSNHPLRGGKRTTLEGGIRVPFLMSWEGHIKPALFHPPVIQLDLHATALSAAGVSPEPKWRLEGVDLLPFLSGRKKGDPHEALYWRLGQQMAIRMGGFKLLRYDNNADTLTGARGQGVTTARLYNLANDIGETKDLAAQMPDKVKELQSKWDRWNVMNVDPLWGGDPTATDNAAAGAKKKKAP